MDPSRLKYPGTQSAALRMADMAIANTGVLVLDTALQVLSANQAARQMVACADALNITSGQLRAIRNTDDVRLKEVCRSAAGSDGDKWHGMVLSRSTGQRNYLLSIAGTRLEGSDMPALHIVIVDPEACLSLAAGPLQTFFGLTPAQGALTRLLGNGFRLEEAATMLGVKISTARTHLTEIFRKTNTDRIPALVRLLATLWTATQLQQAVVGRSRLLYSNEAPPQP